MQKTCPHCGEMIIDGMTLCPACGGSLETQETEPEIKPAVENEMNTVSAAPPAPAAAQTPAKKPAVNDDDDDDDEYDDDDDYEEDEDDDEDEPKKKAGRKKIKKPRKKGAFGKALLVILVIALISAAGYFVYTNYLSPEARFDSAMDKAEEYALSGDYASAVEYFNKAISIDSNSAEAYTGCADAYLAMGKNSEATDNYLMANFIEPGNKELCTKLGAVYFEQQSYENAENYYLEALKLDDKDTALYDSLCDVYIADGARDSAIAILSEGVEKTGSSSLKTRLDALVSDKYGDYVFSGEQSAAAEKYEAAVEAYSSAIATDETRPEAYAGRAAAYAAQEKYKEAAEDYEKAIELGDKSTENYNALADTYTALEDSDKTIATLEAGFEATQDETIKERLTAVEFSVEPGDYSEPFTVEMKSLCSVHYTTDGTEPTADSPEYSEPIAIGAGDTQIKYIAVSPCGITGEIVSVQYNVTTARMKAIAAFEKYYETNCTDDTHEVFILDVSGDGLEDMIIVNKNPEKEGKYVVRVFEYDGSYVTPVYLDSNVAEGELFLVEYEGKTCFAGVKSTEKTVDKKTQKTVEYEIFTLGENNKTETLKNYTETYKDGEKTESDLPEGGLNTVKIIGVESKLIDATGGYSLPESAYVTGGESVIYTDGTFWTTDATAAQELGGKQLSGIDGKFLVYNGKVYYYQNDEQGEGSVYCKDVDAAEGTRIGDGDGETLFISGGWLYVGKGRYNTVTLFDDADHPQLVTDIPEDVEKVILTDGNFNFYKKTGENAVIRAGRDFEDPVTVIPEYNDKAVYFTDNGKLYELTVTGNEVALNAYTVNGSYVYDTVFTFEKLTGKYIVSDGKLYFGTETGVIIVNLADGTKNAQLEPADIQLKDSTLLCAGNDKLTLLDSDGKVIVVNLTDGTAKKLEPAAQEASQETAEQENGEESPSEGSNP